MFANRPTLCLALLLAATTAHAQIGAPTLQWAYGGCSVSSCQTGWYSGPAATDIDGDGLVDVVWGSYDVVALNGTDGTLKWRGTNAQRVWPAIAVADFDLGVVGLESAVGRGGNQLTLYSVSGAVLWTRTPFAGGEVRSLAAADIDGNGDLEIVVGRASSGGDLQVSVYEHNGTLRAGWPARRTGEPGYGAGMYNENLAIADLDGDGQAEIFAPTDTHYITALHPNGNQLTASTVYGLSGGQPKTWAQVGVHVDHAADLAGYANCGLQHRPNFANAAPAIADLDGNGSLELVVPGDVYNCAIGDPDGDLYYLPWILRRDRTRWAAGAFDWSAIPAPGASGGPTIQGDYATIEDAVVNAVLADLDGDGQREILFASYDGLLHAWWLDKTEKHAWPYTVPGSGYRFAAEPAVVDLDDDGNAEVIFSTWPQKGAAAVGKLIVLDSHGALLHSVDLPAPRGGTWNGGLAAPTVAQIDSDPEFEVVLGTSHSGVVVYQIPGSANARVLWGTARGGLLRNGLAPPNPPSSSSIFGDGFE
ncbi:MAG: VCBS repeat-containing protein [Xanthomonadales bacterium]|nr:VCBS repeat-containing protein [Xanthomonadales bacterium]MBK7143815.1 VCBS repeat-containing protein [Xanthomonadales bacterium]